jgi:hypothetical protein
MTLSDQAAIPGHDGQVTSGKPGKPKRRTFTAARNVTAQNSADRCAANGETDLLLRDLHGERGGATQHDHLETGIRAGVRQCSRCR